LAECFVWAGLGCPWPWHGWVVSHTCDWAKDPEWYLEHIGGLYVRCIWVIYFLYILTTVLCSSIYI
jgi:hypothetical protein